MSEIDRSRKKGERDSVREGEGEEICKSAKKVQTSKKKEKKNRQKGGEEDDDEEKMRSEHRSIKKTGSILEDANWNEMKHSLSFCVLVTNREDELKY